MDLVLITAGPKGNARAPCTLSLVAKDGVYLMQIPRPVDDLVLAAGNRHAAFVLTAMSSLPLLQRCRGSERCGLVSRSHSVAAWDYS